MNSIVKALKAMEAEAGKSSRWNLETLCKMAALEIEVKDVRIAELTAGSESMQEDSGRKSLIIFAKEQEISELTRMLFALGKQDGQTIRALAEENRGLRLQLHMEAK